MIYNGATGTAKVIAGVKTCTVSTKCDLIEKSSATSASAKEFISGRTEWDVSMNHLVINEIGVNPGAGLLMRGQTYTLRIVIGDTAYKGTAICMQYDMSAPKNGLATGALKFKGSGELSPVS